MVFAMKTREMSHFCDETGKPFTPRKRTPEKLARRCNIEMSSSVLFAQSRHNAIPFSRGFFDIQIQVEPHHEDAIRRRPRFV